MYLLDSNACIDFLVGRSEALARRIEGTFGQLAVSAVSAGELRVGNRTSSDAEGDLQRVEAFLAAIGVVPFGSEASRAYGTLVRDRGGRRTSFDRLIAAHALSLGLTLVTNNERDFADVPGLRVENWTA